MANISRRIIQQVIGEVPSGTIDGINKVFYISNSPISNTEEIILNGLEQVIGGDYTLTDKKIDQEERTFSEEILIPD